MDQRPRASIVQPTCQHHIFPILLDPFFVKTGKCAKKDMCKILFWPGADEKLRILHFSIDHRNQRPKTHLMSGCRIDISKKVQKVGQPSVHEKVCILVAHFYPIMHVFYATRFLVFLLHFAFCFHHVLSVYIGILFLHFYTYPIGCTYHLE